LTAFDDILSNFEQRLIQTGRSENTIRDRTTDVHRFLGYLEENGIETLKAVKPEIIFSAYEAINGKRHFSASMPTFLRFAYKEGLVGEDYSKVVPKTVIPQRTPSVYTEEEIAAVLAVPNRETPGGMRDYAILVIQSKCGIRCCDMAALKLENINLQARRTSFVQSKTSVPVSFPMDDAIAEALRLYLENGRPRNDSEYLFLSIYAPHRPMTRSSCSTVAKKCFMKSGVDICGRSHGGHAFRSSLASNLVNTNVAYTIVQNVLGQKDVNTVKEYAKIDIERLRICALEVPPAAGALKELLEGSGNG
jgi:site-specific recombinase XerD